MERLSNIKEISIKSIFNILFDRERNNNKNTKNNKRNSN